MKYEIAIRRQRICITSMLILIMWGWRALRSHVSNIKDNPEAGLLFLGLAFGIPIILLTILAFFYTIKAKQSEYDDLDDDFNDNKE